MAYLIERKAQVLYITASLVKDKGKRRKIVIESRPEYAVITLQGLKEEFPISWEHLFEAARRQPAGRKAKDSADNPPGQLGLSAILRHSSFLTLLYCDAEPLRRCELRGTRRANDRALWASARFVSSTS
jgi:hypothetical protein